VEVATSSLEVEMLLMTLCSWTVAGRSAEDYVLTLTLSRLLQDIGIILLSNNVSIFAIFEQTLL
jgi:hypothetical protein